jgi:hypothetical protein
MSVKFEVVTVATSFDDLLELDKKIKQDPNTRIRFSASPSEFLKLTEGQIGRLSGDTQMAYSIAREEHKDLTDSSLNEEEQSALEMIKSGYQSGRAKKRLEIRNKRKGFVYQWIRPDMVDEFVEVRGYRIVKDGPERTMANPNGRGPHVITKEGKAELTAVMRPVEVDRVAKAEKKRRNMQARRDADMAGAAAVERDGFHSVDEGTRGRFAPISEE